MLRAKIETNIHITLALYTMLLLLVSFAQNKLIGNICLSAISILGAIVGSLMIKKRTALALHRKEVMLIVAVTAAVAVMILCLLGLHFGFYQNKHSVKTLYTYIFPISVTVISTEILRSVLLSQKKARITVFSYFLFVFTEVLLFAEQNTFRNVTSFMSLLGLILLPALMSNLLFHKLSSKYGIGSVIPYRLVLSLYSFVLPFGVSLPRALLAFAKIVLPLLLLWFIQKIFEKKTMLISRQRTVLRTVSTVLSFVLMFLCIAFVAGVFPYKTIVVASDSMKGEMSRGDVVVYRDYEGQMIENGQIILFNRDNTLVIHRVVDIKKINGVYRYYTKGDANDGIDTGYITNEALVGITTMKIKYIGYPTVWLHDVFKK